MKAYIFKVEPNPSESMPVGFPVDMLRYDCCWPTRTEDAIKIAVSIRDKLTAEDGWIRLTSIQTPHRDRWLSFGWRVLNELQEVRIG